MSLDLILLPRDQPILDILAEKAKSDLRISRQALPDIEYCDFLLRTRDRGVDVKVLLTDERYFRMKSTQEICEHYNLRRDFVAYSQDSFFSQEEFVYYLNKNGFYPHYINHDKYFLNHSKFFIVDSEALFLGSAYGGGKIRIDVGVISRESEHIKTLTNLFDSDFENREYTDEINSGLAISPNNMRETIEDLLIDAKQSIYLMFPVLTNDEKILTILKQKLKENVKLYILFSPDIFPDGDTRVSDHFYSRYLLQMGAQIKINYDPIIHSKCILIDPEDEKNKKTFIGSLNLRSVSIDRAREVGIVTSKEKMIVSLKAFFNELWLSSVYYS